MGSDTRARMVSTVAQLVMRQGFHGTSLSEILKESQAPRGSLYFHFPGGKDELILEGARAAIAQASESMRDAFEKSPDAASGLAAFFDLLIKMEIETDFHFGCPVNALVSDAMETATPLADLCREGIEQWETIYKQAFVQDGIDPQRAETLASFVLAAEEGAILMARAKRDVEPLETVRDKLVLMLRSEALAQQ